MVAPEVEGVDLFKKAGRSISGWNPSLKMDTAVRQPFCSQLEERLLLWLEYHPQVKSYALGDIGLQFATTYRLLISKHALFVTDEEWMTTLRVSRDALRPGGRLVFEVRDPTKEAWKGWNREQSYQTIECDASISFVNISH